MKGFALGLALKATRKSPICQVMIIFTIRLLSLQPATGEDECDDLPSQYSFPALEFIKLKNRLGFL